MIIKVKEEDFDNFQKKYLRSGYRWITSRKRKISGKIFFRMEGVAFFEIEERKISFIGNYDNFDFFGCCRNFDYEEFFENKLELE